MSDMSTGTTVQLKYRRNNELRAEIVREVGGDPSRYETGGASCGLCKADLVRIAETVTSHDEPSELTLRGLYNTLDAAVDGMNHSHNAGNTWGIERENLKALHRAVHDESQLVTDGGGNVSRAGTERCHRCEERPAEIFPKSSDSPLCRQCVSEIKRESAREGERGQGLSMSNSHGELKRYLAEILGTDPNRYSSETGCERHKRLTAEEIDRVAEYFGMGLSGETKQQTRDAIMIRLGRDHRTGAHTWDASDLVAVIDSLDQLQAVTTHSGEDL